MYGLPCLPCLCESATRSLAICSTLSASLMRSPSLSAPRGPAASGLSTTRRSPRRRCGRVRTRQPGAPLGQRRGPVAVPPAGWLRSSGAAASRQVAAAYGLETALNGAEAFESSEDVAARLGDGGVRGKCIFITGATSGIGKETAKQLAALGARVLISGRTAEMAESTAEEIGAEALPHGLDLSSLASVRAFIAECEEALKEVNVAILNAGLGMVPGRTTTEDGHEIHFGVNHLGHFALLQLPLSGADIGLLVASNPRAWFPLPAAAGRIVASEVHRGWTGGGFNLDALDKLPDEAHGMMAYGHSKLANLLCAAELRRRLEGSPEPVPEVYALCPGFVNTGLSRYIPRTPESEARMEAMFSHESNPTLKTISEGAATSVWLAAAPADELGDHLYWTNCRPMEPSAAALDAEDAARLWEASERMLQNATKP